MANKASRVAKATNILGYETKLTSEVKEHIKIKWKKKIPDGNCKYEKTGNKLQQYNIIEYITRCR